MVIDLSQTIKSKTDQLNADDLKFSDMVIKIRDVKVVLGDPQPVKIYFDGDDNKPFKPCKQMREVMIEIWGQDGSKYIGKRMKLFRDPKVSFSGMEVGGIRIKEMEGITSPKIAHIKVAKGRKQAFKVLPLVLKEEVKKVEAPIVSEVVSVDINDVEFIDTMQAIKDNYKLGQEHFTNWWIKFNDDMKARIKPMLTQEFWNECKKLRADFETNNEIE